MRRFLALATLVALMMSLMAPGLTSAQTGTPAVEASGDFGISLGTAVPYIGSDGAEVGTLTVESITDPFEGYDSYSAPQRGYHYALATVSVTNTSNRPFDLGSSSFTAVDTDGFVVDTAYVSYTDPSITELGYLDALAPGDTATGVVPFSLFADASIETIFFSPSYDRLITILDLRAAPVAAGTPVSIMNTSGAEAAQVTVNSIDTPFEGYDSSSAPPRGSSYVAIDVTVTNTGTSVLSVSASDFQIADDEGFLLSSTYVNRTDTTVADYSYADLAPGESQNGIIVYQIYQGVPVAKVLYGDGYTSLAVVADVDATSTSASPTAATAAVPTAAVPTIEPTATIATASNAECAGLVEWGTDMAERIGRAAALVAPFQMADTSTIDPATVRDIATQLRAMGDEQAASNPPVPAVELNTVMTEQFYYALADSVDQIASALEQNNQAAALAGQMGAMNVTKVFADGGPYDTAIQALTESCPAEVNQLDQL